ncbi:Epimerase domain-containing protein [Gammaproteobacteria bacterium]
MSLHGKKILVAGATGMVGTAILARLLYHDSDLLIRACYHHTEPFFLNPRIEYVKSNIASQEECSRIGMGCDCAVMAAARTSGVGTLTAQPWQQINDNLFMNANLLQGLAMSNMRRLVFIGSATLYQPFDGHIRENQLDLNQNPPDAYTGIGWVTRFNEKLCEFWHRQSGMDIMIIRASNVFGPFARFNPQTSNFIPAIIRKAVDRMDPFEIWGSPEVTRDVIHADDFARAVVLMLERDDIHFDVFNIGSGVQTTVDDVVTWALKYADYTPSRIQYNDQRPTTAAFRALDCSKARSKLDWIPQISIDAGIKNTLEWWQENKNWWNK